MPTLLMAAVGDTTVKEDLLKGRKIGDMTFKVHLDGYNLMPSSKAKARMAASRVHLLDRRRERRGVAVQPLENDLPATELHRLQGLGESFEELRWPD